MNMLYFVDLKVNISRCVRETFRRDGLGTKPTMHPPGSILLVSYPTQMACQQNDEVGCPRQVCWNIYPSDLVG